MEKTFFDCVKQRLECAAQAGCSEAMEEARKKKDKYMEQFVEHHKASLAHLD